MAKACCHTFFFDSHQAVRLQTFFPALVSKSYVSVNMSSSGYQILGYSLPIDHLGSETNSSQGKMNTISLLGKEGRMEELAGLGDPSLKQVILRELCPCHGSLAHSFDLTSETAEANKISSPNVQYVLSAPRPHCQRLCQVIF